LILQFRLQIITGCVVAVTCYIVRGTKTHKDSEKSSI